MFNSDSSNEDEIRVLLIEDDEEDSILFQEYVNEIPFPKYNIKRCKDASAAFAELRSNPSSYRILVIDHFLGSTTGIDLMQELRSVAPNVPAVLISGLPNEEIESNAIKAGFQKTLEKKILSAFSLGKTFYELLNSEKNKPENDPATDPVSLRMETISQFSGGIAHDFNNILNIIIANLDLLEMQCKEQPDVLNRIRSAQNAVMRGAEVNKKLLNFSRKQSLHPEAEDPNRLIAEYLEKPSDVFPENVRVVFEPGPGGNLCRIDRSEFANSLMHLLQNAKEALEENGGTILVETDTILANDEAEWRTLGLDRGNYFFLRIADNGKGIDPNLADKIFEPFVSTKPKGKSSGLGLPMVFGFVKRSGGKIVFESHFGYGSDFYVYLPIEDLKSDARPLGIKSWNGSKKIFYFTKGGESSKRTSYLFQSFGANVRRFEDLRSFESNLSKIDSETIVFSENWVENFSKWKEIVMNAKKSNSNLNVCYFSPSAKQADLENSLEIPWPISRKSLENHLGGL
ncbi:ATP-binding protein [Leptospira kmetyi]|uniref:ATP-binding protein n=1 Tax=Leptospira kmetyi TaxID=408139 RepID=UPI0003906418|nr:ATP-binding protein [Leptospira kmetyi]EQA55113.1 GHKL domain protein [Leptospira kmetyi serovar Malaysia str. Bejo-Iso9]